MKNTKHQLVAQIAKAVAATGDSHEVFAITRAVMADYSRSQNEAMARLVYAASNSATKNSTFRAGFEALTKERDVVLHAVNTARAVYGFQKYSIDDLGVWSAPQKVLTGSSVWKACHSIEDVVGILASNPEQKDMLTAWGRVLTHGDEGAAAAALLPDDVHAAWVKSILAIGAAMDKKGTHADKLVPFGEGKGMKWAVEGYQAVTEGGKPGATLRGVSDAIKAGINSAFFAQRMADSDPMRFITKGHKEAWYILNSGECNPDENPRVEVRRDAGDGQESYAGAGDIEVRVHNGREVNLGNCLERAELEEIIGGIASDYASEAESLLAGAEAMFGCLSCGVKEGDEVHMTFDALKGAVDARLMAGVTERAEAKERNKALERAIIAVQTASTMDAVSRRMFLKAVGVDLPLADAVEALRVAKQAKEDGDARRAAEALKVEAEAAAAARKEAVYAATAKRSAAWAAGAEDRAAAAAAQARAASALDAELAAARAKAGAA